MKDNGTLDLFVEQALADFCRKPTHAEVEDSYSGDRIMDGKVRKPFLYQGQPHIYTGGCYSPAYASHTHECEVVELIALEKFTGKVTSYHEKTADGGEKARSDPNGFYYGMRVKHGRDYVIGRVTALLVFDEADDALLQEIPWEKTDKFQSRFGD
jgi:hypothetical protein